MSQNGYSGFSFYFDELSYDSVRTDKILFTHTCPCMRIGLGIDTGGTYTDSVLIDMDSGAVIGCSKALTTYGDLSSGITESVRGLGSLENIVLVSLSTTLATNAVVEGKGCRVGLITIGKEVTPEIDVAMYGSVEGEFDLRGNLVKELDTEDAEDILHQMKGKVDSVAICGYLSSRFPEHEIRVKELAKTILNVPAVCGHELTAKLGFGERLNTALMNAGLIPGIIRLIDSVKKSLSSLGIDAPLIIVKGDGSVMSSSSAIARPVDTVMSGPASSLTGAMTDPSVTDSLVVDIGGTTTDIGLVSGGFVHTIEEGASICGHRTRVRAADICTYGLGGDSGIKITDGEIKLTEKRVIPICVASSEWSSFKEKLSSAGSVAECTFVIAVDNEHGLPENTPVSLSEAISEYGFTEEKIESFEQERIFSRIAFTPTDVLAAEGKYSEYDSDASVIAADIISSSLSLTRDVFLGKVRNLIVSKLINCIEDYLSRGKGEGMETYGRVGQADGVKEDKFTSIVGIGAPAGAWMPEAASALGLKLVIPEHHDVRNAIGAILSRITEYAEIAVRAAPNDFSVNPECRVYSPDGSHYFRGKEEALNFAKEEGIRIAKERAVASGAKNPEVDVRITENILHDPLNNLDLFRGADVIVKAYAEPDVAMLRKMTSSYNYHKTNTVKRHMYVL